MINIRQNFKIVMATILNTCSCAINLRKTLTELKLTDIKYENMIYKIEEKFNIKINNDIHFNTLEDIVVYLEKEVKSDL